jgi:hypothetical protein
MANARGQYGTSRVGQISPFFSATPSDPLAPNPVVKDYEIGPKGTAVLVATVAVIVGIGIVGAKKGMRLM